MSTVNQPAADPADILKQFAQLLLQPLILTSLPIVAAALPKFSAAGTDPVALALANNSLIGDLNDNLVSVKNTDFAAIIQVASAIVTAFGAKFAASSVTAAGVGAAIAGQITGQTAGS